MRITRVDPGYLKQRRENGSGEPYRKQYQDFILDSYGWSDYWSRALGALEYECWEPVANARAMQLRWAEEKGVKFSESNWENEVLAAQVKSFRPEVILVDDHLAFSADFIRDLRRDTPSLRLVIVWCGSPPGNPAIFREADLTLSNIPELVKLLSEGDAKIQYLPHAFDGEVLNRITRGAAKEYELTFAGSLVSHAGYHNTRRELLEELLKRSRLVIFSPVWMPGAMQRVKSTIKSVLGAQQPEMFGYDLTAEARANVRPPVYGRQMFEMLTRSKAVLNTHIDVSKNSASNMRLFEVTGVGSCLLTDWKENIREFFEPDTEVVTYSSVEDCVEKARWLSENSAARERIAKAGQERTLRDHSFTKRAEALDEIIRRALG